MSSRIEDENYQREKDKAAALDRIASNSFDSATVLEKVSEDLERLTVAAESIAATLAELVKCLKENS
jgi:hypothetical protein